MSKGCSFFDNSNFSSLLLADLLSLFHFIHSQPLYFAYLIFFFPHLLQLLLFLCPLLLSTSLLLVAFVVVSGNPVLDELNWRYGLFSFACKTFLDILETRMDDEVMFHLFEPLVSFASTLEDWMEFEFEELNYQGREDDLIDHATRGQCQFIGANESEDVINSRIESFGWEIEETHKDTDDYNRVAAANYVRASSNQEVTSWAISSLSHTEKPRVGEELLVDLASTNLTEDTRRDHENCDATALDLKGYGSKKREKEWERTLACKLYEERLSVRRAEEMDLLWEVYEADSGVRKENDDDGTDHSVRNGKLDHLYEEEEEIDEQVCCLEAIRFSTMKVNWGVRKHNLVKISKAFKGVGMFVKRKGKISI